VERTPSLAPATQPIPITQLTTTDTGPVPTGIDELDRVLGGGLVPGSVTLLGGEPGVGKSTLVLQMLAARARTGSTVLYVTGEESIEQVRLRAERLGALVDRLMLVAETALPNVIAHIDALGPDVCVVDSVQTMYDPTYSSAPGSVTQVRECAHRLVQEAKRRGVTMVVVGHVTKDGQLAGPRVLEHVVDTVLSIDGDRHHDLRFVRAVKHRFGSTEELGLMAVCSTGLESVADPSGLFLGDRCAGIAGSLVTPAMEGHRPLLVEVQALVAESQLPQPRRSVHGLDGGRVALLVAVLSRRLKLPIGPQDIYAMAVGGVKVMEPGADLAIALAIASSLAERPLPAGVVACGEVGLGGELRQVARIERRLAEAARLGFTQAVVPRSAPVVDAPIELLRVPSLAAAIELFDLRSHDPTE